MDECRETSEQARHAALAAERDAREGARAIDAAAAALERIEAQRSGFVQRQTDLEPVLEAARDAVADAERTLAALPDPAVLEQELDETQRCGESPPMLWPRKRAGQRPRSPGDGADRGAPLALPPQRAGGMVQSADEGMPRATGPSESSGRTGRPHERSEAGAGAS